MLKGRPLMPALRMYALAVVPLIVLLTPSWVWAQGWSFDARRIALGGGGDSVAMTALDDQADGRVIVIPLGLIQVVQNLDVFRPDSDQFDLVSAVEYAASPLHYVIGRDDASDTGRNFSADIRNARLSRDLNDYRGFRLANQPEAAGLAAPNWGGTITLYRAADGARHGLYVGAGPYLSLRSAVAFDHRLVDLLASETDVVIANARLRLGNDSEGQSAAAITAGYRGRIPLPSVAGRGVLIVAVSYNYLRGFHYEHADTTVTLVTDDKGLVLPGIDLDGFTFPVLIDRRRATKGSGRSVDVGVGAVIDRWAIGLGVRGIANHIDWADVTRTRYALFSALGGEDFAPTQTRPDPDVRVTLPVDTHGSVAYRGDVFSATVDVARGFQGTSFRGGVERRVGPFAVRGGTFYTRERWHPSGGLGLNFGRRVALDVALFGTSANAARESRAALAASLRLRP